MAPAIREVTQTFIEEGTTVVQVVTLNTKPWPTLNLVTFTVTTPHTTVLRVIDTATSAPDTTNSDKSSGLSNADKGTIAGSILGAAVFLLLLYYCHLCRLQRTSTRRSAKIPLDPKDPEASDPAPPDPSPTDNPSKKKKTVTISSDLPRYFPPYSASKSTKPIISPLVRITTEMNLRTGLETRAGRLGQPVRFLIREREKPPRVKKRRRHRRRSKHKAKADQH
ncbi:uncharacterized protein N7479_008277 [Penicillium vulpinum]|uniref:Mid2 domain-containing protein n=1 Tax=Penicillium vulpinum TaxID=29845 RepID=A0A1V6RJB4_9EURO|nr:uncharacterized protein N7479_008277 [Penicillium vulpinum]KAJ5961127.1 hypothetical protein N7479_008277 [Penicillium vulpinum]OQE01630.1 hypothetical protein PENVUL_c042G08545 [Penicillium vulpinum]